MTEFVVARTAQVGASVAVKVGVALDAVAVRQRVIGRIRERVVLPRRRLAPALRGHLHNETVA